MFLVKKYRNIFPQKCDGWKLTLERKHNHTNRNCILSSQIKHTDEFWTFGHPDCNSSLTQNNLFFYKVNSLLFKQNIWKFNSKVATIKMTIIHHSQHLDAFISCQTCYWMATLFPLWCIQGHFSIWNLTVVCWTEMTKNTITFLNMILFHNVPVYCWLSSGFEFPTSIRETFSAADHRLSNVKVSLNEEFVFSCITTWQHDNLTRSKINTDCDGLSHLSHQSET